MTCALDTTTITNNKLSLSSLTFFDIVSKTLLHAPKNDATASLVQKFHTTVNNVSSYHSELTKTFNYSRKNRDDFSSIVDHISSATATKTSVLLLIQNKI